MRVIERPLKYSLPDGEAVYFPDWEEECWDEDEIFSDATEYARSLLAQSEHWIDKDGEVHRVPDIDHLYARNIIRYLKGFKNTLHDGACSAGVAGRNEDADEWLERQPLVVALRERIDAAL